MDSHAHSAEGLRQRKHRETRAALSLAATRLFVQRGFGNVTVDDIAAAANVSPRTFRNYFSNKAEAVAAGHLERMLRIADEFRARPAGEPLWAAIANSATAQFENPATTSAITSNAKRWSERLRVLFAEPAIHGEVLRANEAARIELAKAVAERTGTPENDLSAHITAAVAISVINLVSERWFSDGPTGSIIPMLRQAFAQFSI